MKALSVIIVTYNSEKDIYDCVASLQQFSDLPKDELELIVVDNDSKDPDPMFARLKQQWGEDIILIKNSHNGGYGQGNNVGIKHSSAPVILIVNPDVRLVVPVFKTVCEAFRKNPRLGMYGMKQMLTPTCPSHNSFCCTTMMNGYLYALLTGICNRINWYIPRYMYFQGSCFFVRKEMFEQIGLYDESVFMYGEEDDIHYRMRQQHHCQFKYNPKFHYLHLTQDRKPSLEYEKKLLHVAIIQNEKKGYPRKKTIHNRLQNFRFLLMKQRLKRLFGIHNPELLEMWNSFYDYMKSL